MGLAEIYHRWTSVSLILRILAGIAAGSVLALLVPGLTAVSVIGDMFVGSLKGIAPLLVFVLVFAAIAFSGRGLGSRFRLVIILYIGTTLVASAVATVLTYAFPVEVSFIEPPEVVPPTTDVADFLAQILRDMVTNPVSALAQGNFISILFWAVLSGLVARSVLSDRTKEILKQGADLMTGLVRIIIEFAPFGIMGLIYRTVSENGLDVFADYAQLIVLLLAAMFVVMFVTNPIIAGVIMGRNPYPLVFRCLRDSGVPAFFTRSSAACIPMNMELCESMGIDKPFYSVSIPLGSTINMNGAAITITVMSLVAAFSMGLEIPMSVAAGLCMLSAVAACGASGVSGGSLMLIPMCCSLLGVSGDVAAEMIGIGFVIGVIQDSVETMLNVSMDSVFTAVAEVRDKKDRGIDFHLKL